MRCLTETTVILRARHSRLCQKKKADHMTSLSLCLSHTIHLPPPGWEVSCVGVSLYIQHLFSAAATLCNMSACHMACQSSRNSFISVSTHKTLWLTSWIPINVLQSNRDFFFYLILTQCPNKEKCYHMKQDAYLCKVLTKALNPRQLHRMMLTKSKI